MVVLTCGGTVFDSDTFDGQPPAIMVMFSSSPDEHVFVATFVSVIEFASVLTDWEASTSIEHVPSCSERLSTLLTALAVGNGFQ